MDFISSTLSTHQISSRKRFHCSATSRNPTNTYLLRRTRIPSCYLTIRLPLKQRHDLLPKVVASNPSREAKIHHGQSRRYIAIASISFANQSPRISILHTTGSDQHQPKLHSLICIHREFTIYLPRSRFKPRHRIRFPHPHSYSSPPSATPVSSPSHSQSPCSCSLPPSAP